MEQEVRGAKKMRYVIDIDGCICKNKHPDYENSTPVKKVIDKINKLYDEGHTITLYTARGASSGKDWSELTKKQLKEWGVKHHRLLCNKPAGDVYVDDKAVNIKEWV